MRSDGSIWAAASVPERKLTRSSMIVGMASLGRSVMIFIARVEWGVDALVVAPLGSTSGKAMVWGGLKMLKIGLPGNTAMSAPNPPTTRAAKRIVPLILKSATPHHVHRNLRARARIECSAGGARFTVGPV